MRNENEVRQDIIDHLAALPGLKTPEDVREEWWIRVGDLLEEAVEVGILPEVSEQEDW